MYYLLVILVRVIDIALTVLQVLMIVRAVLSWLPDIDNAFTNFIYAVTEPIIMPVRSLIERFSFAQMMPIDMSFMITYILLLVIQMLLPNI